MDFTAFPKMPRLSRDVVITEKLDGTNAQIYIVEMEGQSIDGALYEKDGLALFAGSRTRWITPADDNYGFARWAYDHADKLLHLGPGRHFGEWWGKGIQRGYGLDEKRFSLFNTFRWSDDTARPACCHVVPVLYQGMLHTERVEGCIDQLRQGGSIAAPGFAKPEGVIVFHTAGNFGMKKTLDKDESPKSAYM